MSIVEHYKRFLADTGSEVAAAIFALDAVHKAQAPVEPQADNSEYLTVKQAAKKYNLGERTLYRMIENGLAVTRVGKAIRIRPRDLVKWLADSETVLR